MKGWRAAPAPVPVRATRMMLRRCPRRPEDPRRWHPGTVQKCRLYTSWKDASCEYNIFVPAYHPMAKMGEPRAPGLQCSPRGFRSLIEHRRGRRGQPASGALLRRRLRALTCRQGPAPDALRAPAHLPWLTQAGVRGGPTEQAAALYSGAARLAASAVRRRSCAAASSAFARSSM